ncbi:MAG TPA: tyrosine-type recombinase/integrase, partial [Acidimicrobiales bacterium]|nr:tyrosine-type recombinase/integrase [Acidimicrobiales bacterium]
WNPVRVAYGDPDLDFYALRHSYGTMLARHGVGAPAIALMMGHTDGGKLALQRYIHMTALDARAEVRTALERRILRVVSSDEAETA